MLNDDGADLPPLGEALFHGTPDVARRAGDAYRAIVGSESIVRLTVALRLRLTEGGQDWDIEVADADRVPEFLDCYEGRRPDVSLDDAERMDLLRLLIDAFDLQRELIEYWAAGQDPDPPRFQVSSLMRDILRSRAG